MGLQGKPIQSISNIIEKMYFLFLQRDLDLIEINPLGINKEGEVMALDGKINVNDYGLARHSSLLELTRSNRTAKSAKTQPESTDSRTKISLLDGIDEKGNIAVVCSGLDLALATWDTIVLGKGKLSCCYVIDEDRNDSSTFDRHLEVSLDKILEIKTIKTIYISLRGIGEKYEMTINNILTYLQSSLETNNVEITPSKPKKTERIQLVFHLSPASLDRTKNMVFGSSIYFYDNLEEAVEKTITLSKSK
jgi:succinyl-CoA synthetase beta subunit